MAFEYAVVLTGSIATGKSSAAKILSALGFEIIDADCVTHLILNEEHQAISLLFGQDVVNKGIVDRKALGAIVFNNDEKRKQLEGLLHPLIFNRIEAQSKALDEKKIPYLIDIPLFFENERYTISKSVVVYTPESLQIERLMKRDNSTREEAKNRISLQLPIEEKKSKADYVIDNSGTLLHLEHECKRVQEQILKDF